MKKPRFEVCSAGLAKILARRGIEFTVLELIQNALDEKCTKVQVHLERLDTSHYRLSVEDDNPAGFKNLAHAYTLFAESEKKNNPEQRGRFNIGEKLAIAVCKEAKISTTKGTIIFTDKSRTHSSVKTECGSIFSGILRLKKDEATSIERVVRQVIIPKGITLTFNGTQLPEWTPIAHFEAFLPTEKADAEGYLRPTRRKTVIEVYNLACNSVFKGSGSQLYEMGIPVVAIDCDYHINICQKVPLNSDRDNVTPAYIREVRTLVLNEMCNFISEEMARSPWVGDALESGIVTDAAVHAVLTARYGEKRVIADPSDMEGTKLAVSKGYQVIQAGSFNAAQWYNIKRSGAALPAGKVTPSPKPFSNDPSAPSVHIIDPQDWTPDMRAKADYAMKLATLLIHNQITVQMVSTSNGFLACYGNGILMFNVKRLGKKWFETQDLEPVDELLIHELGHHFSMDHLSEEYHNALCQLGAKLKRLALEGYLK
jgi:hypothetical protein